MDIRIKTYSSLHTDELYALLQLRSEIFVVEQECVYQDMDGKDQDALHVMGWIGDELVGYTRIFAPGDYFEQASIGRVAVKRNHRGRGLGMLLMKASMEAARSRFCTSLIVLSAQSYLKRFYEDLGFTAEGEEYLEDGIPHIRMTRGDSPE